ncbi:MAG: hypothetical protein QXK12_08670 [Candidatus Nezhaarchaeales archaeon]
MHFVRLRVEAAGSEPEEVPKVREVVAGMEVKKVKVSRKGLSTTVFFEDGSKDVIPFENFLKTFGDYRRSVYEYMTYVFAYVSSRDRSDLAHEAVKEIKAKLLPP